MLAAVRKSPLAAAGPCSFDGLPACCFLGFDLGSGIVGRIISVVGCPPSLLAVATTGFGAGGMLAGFDGLGRAIILAAWARVFLRSLRDEQGRISLGSWATARLYDSATGTAGKEGTHFGTTFSFSTVAGAVLSSTFFVLAVGTVYPFSSI